MAAARAGSMAAVLCTAATLIVLLLAISSVSAYPRHKATSKTAAALMEDPHYQDATDMYGALEPLRKNYSRHPELYDSVLSSWRCTPHHSINVSCLFHNLYVNKTGTFVILLRNDNYPVRSYNLRLGHLSSMRAPAPLRFDSVESAMSFLGETDVSEHLTMYYSLPWGWASNFGHMHFDGLYPSYLGLVEFGLHNEAFDQVVYSKECIDKTLCPSHEHMAKFGGGKLTTWHELGLRYNETAATRFLQLKLAIMGASNKPQRLLNREVTVAGRSLDGLWKFSRRMFERYNINLKPLSKDKFVVNIFHNKRFTAADKVKLRDLVKKFNETIKSPIKVRYLTWGEVPTYRQQLELLAETDVYVSGPGTGLMAHPFMRAGTFVINLGSCWTPNPRDNRTNKFSIPLFMEMYMCEAAPYQKCYYTDSRTRCLGFNVTELEELIHRAYSERGFRVPVPQGDIPPEGKVFKEMCAQFPQICDKVLAYFVSRAAPPWLEQYVYEVGPFDPTFSDPRMFGNPFIDRESLRSVRKKYEHLLQKMPEPASNASASATALSALRPAPKPAPAARMKMK
eukprot:m.111990 g.111990  ORF g.111990 m.111990 type:complete len:566 (-) comp15965_c0_seq1:350-2047(-)